MPKLARKAGVALLSLLGVLLIGYLDYRTGFDVALGALYAIPIAFASWYLNAGWGVLFSILASFVRYWADSADGHHFSRPWIPIERGINFVLIFSFIAFSFHTFRRNFEMKDRKVRQLEGILPICIACKRISNPKGEWMDLDAYLRQHSSAQPEPCICPECMGARFR